MAIRSSQIASYRGARQIKDSDVLQAIHTNEALSFLKMDFPRKAFQSDASLSSARSQTAAIANRKQTHRKSSVVKQSAIVGSIDPAATFSEDGVNRSLDSFESLENVPGENEAPLEVTNTGKHSIRNFFQPSSKIAHTIDNDQNDTMETATESSRKIIPDNDHTQESHDNGLLVEEQETDRDILNAAVHTNVPSSINSANPYAAFLL